MMHGFSSLPNQLLVGVLQDPEPTQMLGGETTTQPAQGPGPGAPPPEGAAPGGSNIFFIFIVFTVGMLLIMSLSGRKEKKRRATLLESLGKRDKVRTAGGIIGTIVEMKKDEVLLETDRASNTRLWISKGSVAAVINSAGAKTESASETEESEEKNPAV